MSGNCCCGWGKFAAGLAMGMAGGMVLGLSMTPSHRKLKRAANMAAKRVNEAVESLADAMDL